MANKYYAIRKGKKTGIFTNWDECKEYVLGYPSAEYKSFKKREEAEAYVNHKPSVEADALKEDHTHINNRTEAIAYVDGSYHSETKTFAYGAVILWDNKEYHFSGKYDDEELAKMHNVAGEIKGAEKAMAFALENDIKSLTIYHDYEGIAKWCTGEWKTNKEGTKAYKDFYNDAKRKLQIEFVKVKAHSGNKYNELADKLAKEAFLK